VSGINLQEADFVEIRRSWKKAEAKRGLAIIRERSPRSLAWLLRHHAEKAISNEETWLRDDVDYALHYYAALEMACLAGIIRVDTLPKSEHATAMRVLNDPAVSTYYDEHYRVVLPRLFRLRLAGQWSMVTASAEARGLVTDLFRISAPFDRSASIETFLWFLDGGRRWDESEDKYVDIDDTLNSVLKTRDFGERLTRRPKGQLDRSVHGLSEFVEFSVAFDALLAEAGALPIIRDAMWEFKSYWFKKFRRIIMSRVRGTVRGLVLQVMAVQQVSDDLKASVAAEGDVVERALQRLVVDRSAFHHREMPYGVALSAAVAASTKAAKGKR